MNAGDAASLVLPKLLTLYSPIDESISSANPESCRSGWSNAAISDAFVYFVNN